MTKEIILRTVGGFGKQIVATGVARAIKEAFPGCVLHVETTYPDAFVNLPFVDRVFPAIPKPYFFEDHQNFEVLNVEPYLDLAWRQGKTTLIEAWCRRLNIPQPKENRGFIEISDEDAAVGKALLAPYKQQAAGRPIIAFQPFGGTSFYKPGDANIPDKVMTYRNLPVQAAQSIVNIMVESGFVVVQMSLSSETKLENCIHLPPDFDKFPRYSLAILAECQGLIGVDSMAQHAWVAMGRKNAVVLWGGTHASAQGYSCNTNLFSAKGKECPSIPCNRPMTFLSDVLCNGQVWRCPRKAVCMEFSPKEVVEALKAVIPLKQEEKK